MQLVYGKTASKSTTASEMEQISEDDDSEDDEFFKPKGEGKKACVEMKLVLFIQFIICQLLFIFSGAGSHFFLPCFIGLLIAACFLIYSERKRCLI